VVAVVLQAAGRAGAIGTATGVRLRPGRWRPRARPVLHVAFDGLSCVDVRDQVLLIMRDRELPGCVAEMIALDGVVTGTDRNASPVEADAFVRVEEQLHRPFSLLGAEGLERYPPCLVEGAAPTMPVLERL